MDNQTKNASRGDEARSKEGFVDRFIEMVKENFEEDDLIPGWESELRELIKRPREEMKKNIRFMVLQESILRMQICCNLSPEEMKERKKEVEALLPFAGTRRGLEVDLETEELAPVPCADDEGHWHYICRC